MIPTSPEVMRGLAANPGLDLRVLEPLLGSPDRSTLLALAERGDLTDAAVAVLARQPDPTVRIALGRNPLAAVLAWPLLVDDTDAEVRRALAVGHSTDFRPAVDLPLPETAQWRLTDDSDAIVRRTLAARRDLSIPVGVRLASDPDARVREAIASWWSLPASVHPALLRDEDPQVRRAVLACATPPPQMQADLLADPVTRSRAAARVRLDRHGVAELLTDADADVRASVAGNEQLPFAWLLPLADDDDEDVRTALMLRPDLPDDVRERIAANVAPQDYHLAWWLTARYASLERRLAYVTSRFVFCRRAVALSPDLPDWAVARLATDDDHGVRLLLAENHADAPGDVLREVMLWGGHTRWDLVRHRNMPPDALAEFALSDDMGLYRAAATAPNLPTASALALTEHPDLTTRQLVAANPVLALPKVLDLLADPLVAPAAATNPRLPHELARTLIADRASIP